MTRYPAAKKVACIRKILCPGSDMDHSWDPDAIDGIARVILDYDFRRLQKRQARRRRSRSAA